MAGGKRPGSGKTGSGAPWNGITVLLVDDDEGVRALAETTLDTHGYMVLKALDSDQALRVSDAHTGSIHLLITDQVMPPFMSGTELAACLRLMRPDIKVLYISGYAATDGVADEVEDASAHFLSKPFSPDALLQKVERLTAASSDEQRAAPLN
jgi:two-component system cell cycle sensor histidine kinase/response regulator CckA